MADARFTPGPWAIQEFGSNDEGYWIEGDCNAIHGKLVCELPPEPWSEFNAPLIAAAPDLYEACQVARRHTLEAQEWYGVGGEGILAMLDEVLAKARCETP
jgi:hypothetical protein